MDASPSVLTRRFLAGLGAGILLLTGCPSADDGTGVGGVLIVSQIQIEAGLRDVLIGGTRQLTATPRTSTGIAVPGKTVTWSSATPGVATVDASGLVRGVTQGSASIRAAVDGVTGQVTVDVRPVPVASVTVTLGAGSLIAGETTTAQAAAFDSIGGPLAGRVVAWSSSAPGVATVAATGAVTALSAGSVNITATIEGRIGLAPLNVLPRTAVKLGFTTQPTQTVAGMAIAPPVRVAFQDGAGSTATTATGTITITFSANPTGATLSGTQSAPAVAGVATFANLQVNKAGQPYSLQATAAGVAGATSSSFAVVAGPAAALAIATSPAGSAASGAPLGVQPAIELRDALGNVVVLGGVTITAGVATGPGTLTGTVTAVTNAAGRATFVDLAILGAVGSYTLQFQAPGLADAISSPIAIGAGGATQLTFNSAPPAAAVNAEILVPPFRVQLRDGTGNPVAQGGVAVTASLATGNGILAGTLNALTAANGEALFPDLRFTGVVGTFSIQFASAGLSPATTNPIAVVAGTERTLGFLVSPPATAINGAPLSVAPVMQLRDVSGNPVAKAGVLVSITVQTPVIGTLQGTTTQATDAQGQATFSDLSLLGQVGPYALTFRSGTLSEAIANPLQLQPGPGTALALSTAPPAGTQSGVALAPAPVVQVVDQSGNPVGSAGVSVVASLASGPGVLGGTLAATTATGGSATFGNLVLMGPTGGYTIRFTATGLPALVSPTITVGAGAATQLAFTTAPPATAQNGTPVAPAVVVQLRDGVGNPSAQAGVTVTASLASGPGLLGGTVTATTDGGGTATFSNLVITGTVGSYVLQFATPGLTTAVANPLTLTAGAATQLTFNTAPPATATNGIDLAPPIEVQLRDLSGNPVVQAGVSVSAALVPSGGPTLTGTTPVATGAGGSATFTNLRLTGPTGSYTLQFSAPGVTSATSNAIALQAGAATALAMVTQPPPAAASGVVLSPQPAVRLVDQSGNPVGTSSVTVTASLATGPGTLGGTLTATTVSGVATFTNLAVTGTTGSYSIRFTAAGVTDVVSGSIGVGAGAATALQFAAVPPTAATNGVAIAPSIRVRLVDGSSNSVNQAGVVVTAVLVSGPGLLGGTVSEITNGGGQATFANLVLTGTAGSYTIRFDVSGIASVTTPTITLSAGSATQLVVTTQPPGTATNGVDFGTPTVVQLRDMSGNNVTTAGTSITASLFSGSGVLSGTLAVATSAGGAATFGTLRVTGAVGTKVIRFSAAGLTSVNANPVTLGPGPATALAIVTAPGASTTNGQLLSPQPVIELRDQSNNPVASAGVPVTVVFDSTPGAASLGGTTTVATGANGQAAFTDVAISGTAGGYKLGFSASGLTGIVSGVITLAAGSASQLTFTTAPPATGTNGIDLAPPIVVQARDAIGNPVAQAGLSVMAALGTNPGGVLSGTSPVLTNASGTATFSNLRITGTSGTYTLTFSSGGLTPAASNSIAIGAGVATQMAFATAPPITAANGATLAPAPVVELRDGSNNLVAATGTGITASLIAGPVGSLGGTVTVNTTGGSATFSDLQVSGLEGNYTLRFASAGLPNLDAPAALTLTAGPAAAIGFATPPPGAATSGVALTPQPQVQVRDQSGNPVAQSGLLVTATVSVGATVANATATTDAAGQATFSGLAITGPSASYTLTFQATGFPDLVSGAIVIGAGAATQIVFTTAPSTSAVNGVPLTTQPVVEIRDGSGNPVLVAGTNVVASLLSGSGFLVGTTTVQTDANGRATFTDLELQGNPGSYVVRFASAGVPNLDAATITLAIGPAETLVFQTAPPGTATNGTAFGASTVVALADVTGNLVPTDGVSVSVAIATGPGATLGGTTTQATVSGLATFGDLSLTGTGGGYTLDFTSPGLTKATSNSITLQPGQATHLFFVNIPGIPATGSTDVALTPAPIVQLRDANNNNVSQAGVTILAALFSPSGNGAVLSGGSVATDANGRATFSALTISGPATDYVLSFTSSPLTGLVSTPVTIGAGAAVKLAFITAPSTTAINGAVLAQQPTVELRDAADNPVLQAGQAITVGVGTGAGTLTGTQLVVNTLADGRATFAGLTITGPAGVHTLEFSGAGLSTLVSADITVDPGPAHALLVVGQPPATAVSGSGFSSDPSARLVDSSGNAVLIAGTSVTVALAPGGGGATLGGTTIQATDAGGVATFPGLSITGPGGNYLLEFSSGALVPDTSSAVALTAATKLSVTTQPSASVSNDVAFPQQPQVQVLDAGNAPVALAGVVVTAAIGNGADTLLGTTTATTDANGLASFASLRIQGLIGVRDLDFTAPGLTGVTSANVTVTPGSATALAVVTQPQATTVDGEPLTATPGVKLVDVSGNDVDSAGVNIDVAPTPAGAALNGTTTQPTDAAGDASFAGLGLSGTAGTYQLAFSGTGLTAIQSTDVILVVPDTIVLTVAPPANAVDDALLSPQPTIRVDDSGATPLTGVSVTVDLVVVSGAGTLAGTTVLVTGAGGTIAWGDLKIQTSGGTGQFRLRFRTANGAETLSGLIDIP